MGRKKKDLDPTKGMSPDQRDEYRSAIMERASEVLNTLKEKTIAENTSDIERKTRHSRATIEAILSKAAAPNSTLLAMLITEFGVNANYILSGNGSMFLKDLPAYYTGELAKENEQLKEEIAKERNIVNVLLENRRGKSQ